MHDYQVADGRPASKTGGKIAAEAVADASLEFMLYRHVLNNTEAQAVFAVDPQQDYRLVFGHEAVCRFTGKSVGKSLSDHVPGLTLSRLKKLWRELVKNGSASIETDLYMESGQSIAILISFSLFEYAGQQLMAGCLRGITGRNRLDEALRISRDSLSEAQRIAPFGSWELDLVNNDLTWSDEIFRVFEIEREQFGATYEAFLDAVHPDDRDVVHRAYTESLKNRQPCQIEHRLLMADGRIKYVLECCETVYSDIGKPLVSIGTVQDITDRKRYEQALLERVEVEQRQSQFFNIAPGLFYTLVLQPDGGIAMPFASAGLIDLYGLRPDEVAEDISLLINRAHPDDIAMTFDAMEESARNLSPYHGEYRICHPEKGLRWVEVRSIPQRQADGNICWHGFMHDVTERKRAEEQLQQQLDFRKTLLDAMYDVGLQVMVVENGAIIHVGNRKLARQLGYSDAEINGPTPLMDIVHPDDRLRLSDYYRRRLAGEAVPNSYDMGLITRDGERREFEVAVAIIPNTDPVRIVTVSKDITERKGGEALIEKQLEFERRLSRMADNIPGFLYIFKFDANGQGSFPYTSSGIRDIYGLQPEDVVDDMTPLHSMAHPDDRPLIEAAIADSVQTLTPFHQEIRIRHPIKGEIWVEAKSVPVLAERDGCFLFHGLMLDITERKRIENTLSFIAQCGWKDSGEPFLTALARYLGRMLAVDYVIIDRLADDPANAETVAIYARGEVLPNMQYSLKGTPCDNVMEGGLCCYADNVQQQFPEDILLVDMQVESYAGLPLWDSTGKVIGLIAVMDGKPISDTVAVTSILQLVATSASAELERRRSEQALSESRQFLNKVIDTIPDPVFVKDRQHRWILLNQAFCKLIGQPLEELLGKSDFDFFPLHEAEVFWAKDEAVFSSGKENVNEEDFTGRDGFVRTIVTKKTCYASDSGELFLVGIILDITERKCIEMALAAREQELRSLAESSPGMMGSFHLRPDGSVCMPYVSPNIHDLFGLHPLDVAHDAGPLMALNHPDDAGRVSESIIESASTMTVWHQEYRILHPTRGERWMEGHTKPERHPDGGIIWYGYIHDITERKRGAEQLEFMSYALDNVREAVYLIDEEARIVQANEEGCRVLGYAREELLSMQIFDINPYFGPEQWRQHWDNLCAGNWEVLETYHQTKDGHIFPVEVCANRIVYQGGASLNMALIRDISERKRSEEQIALLAHALDHVSEAVYLIDENAGFVQVNEGACRALGYTREELLSMRVFDIDPDFGPEQWRQAKLANLAGMTSATIETRHRRKDGRIFPVEISANHMVYQNGQRYDMALARDITERKKVLEALQNSRSLLEDAQRIAHIGSWEVDIVNDVLTWSDETFRIWEIDKTHFAATFAAFMETVHPEDREKVNDAYHESLKNKTLYQVEHRLLFADGRVKYIAERGEPFYDAEGRPVRFVGVSLDITERKAMEAAVRQREQEFRILVESSPDLIFRYDKDCRRIYVNPAVERMTGKSAADLLHKAPSGASVVSAREGEKLEFIIRQVLETGQIVEGDVEFIAPSGQVHYFHNRYAPEFGLSGEVSGVISMARDITERKMAETLLRKREEEMRTLLDKSPDIIVSYDRDCRRVFSNRAHEMLGDKPRSETVGKTPLEDWVAPTGPEQAEYFMTRLRSIMETGQDEEWDIKWTDSDGQPVCFALRGQPEFDADGRIIGAMTFARDISARVRAELAMLAREREFRSLVENLPTVVVRYDRDFNRVYTNPAYWQMAGRAEPEIIGKPVGASWRATNISPESYTAILAEAVNSGTTDEVLLEWGDGNGRLITHAMKIVPEYDAEGQATGVLALGFDISERRQQQIVEANRLRVFEKMARGDDINSILEQVALYVESAKPGQHCCILLLNEERKLLQTVAAPSFPESYRAKLDSLVLAEESRHCFGWVASALRSESVILEDLSKHQCWTVCQTFIREIGAEACWSEPIFSASNQLLGIVSLYINQSGEPGETDLAMLRQACHLSSIAIERKRIEQKMHHQASYDPLTGLPNRRMFINRLHEEASKCRRNGSSLALLFIDLDHFKEVNDTLGHQFGDLLLVETAERIRNSVRESDIVARLAGDEFVVIITHSADNSNAGLVGQHIVNALSERFLLENCSAHISASVGIACYPNDTDDIDQLLGYADQSMYAVKKAGRNGVNFFTRSMQDQAQERLQLSNDLRTALQYGQLQVHFQPIVNVKTGQVEKAEALIRWQHPQRGMVRPDLFIPLAEESGAIHEIGDWVFRQSAGVALQWQRLCANSGYCAKTCQISVNMSPRQFVRGNPDMAWVEHLQAIGLNPEAIVIEITEGLLLDDQADVTNKLRRFHEAGMQIALDDFGTGYSAMAYLKKFNIDYLKIDRSFVRDLETDPGDRAIAEAIVVMSHRLGLKVIAEGVETEGQRAMLAAVGCEYVQGYLYAKPMPVEAFLAYVGHDVSQL